jgi:hypothetical protein
LSLSWPFLTPSLQVATPQDPETQEALWQSAAVLHFFPSAQRFEQLPPQSTSVSVPSFTKFAQA